jgi:hypothetical protein
MSIRHDPELHWEIFETIRERFGRDAFDNIVVDEFHHAAAPTYRGIPWRNAPGQFLPRSGPARLRRAAERRLIEPVGQISRSMVKSRSRPRLPPWRERT